ncbi:DUF3087 family protein [Pseudomonas stutzeri]|uniref:DUF3087 domain-containing protein n=1 Tax=Stutzerimonas stutzeri KOS6 TaxID=1218352 RepID=A0A061JTX6_STUST|nr:DUF3087 domain-containing protein [Stutzerimonas stutzeri]EWC41629.1 hypothetical protein B597_009425 [Stutzerimonas stutzeri KOS6]MBK3867937.1 DUF3087 family protein [Stutzerimonas stutzeri]
MVLFEITPLSPETYRRQTRRSTLVVVATFVVLAMGLSALAVMLLGEAGGDNLRLNIAGVVAGLALTIALVRLLYWQQAWMACAVYGWQLKRSLMRVTNMMHQVKAGVSAGDPAAMKLLRFYHQGLTQMHQLDGNASGLSDSVAEINRHQEAMEALGMDVDQRRLQSEWLERVGQIEAKR